LVIPWPYFIRSNQLQQASEARRLRSTGTAFKDYGLIATAAVLHFRPAILAVYSPSIILFPTACFRFYCSTTHLTFQIVLGPDDQPFLLILSLFFTLHCFLFSPAVYPVK